MEKSWAKVFSDEIFPAIDEERFRVVFSKCFTTQYPVNTIVGALIIKELFALSDDEIVENLMLDIHYQYALHTTSYEEQPLSDKSLSRFRKRCYEYEKTTGVDLFHECVCDLNRKIAKLMGINSHVKRMDSLMIEANIRKLSRIELLYSCVARLAKRIEKKEGIGKLTGWNITASQVTAISSCIIAGTQI
ncbi:MAG: transposase [Ruthenibacterium lactatiformans]